MTLAYPKEGKSDGKKCGQPIGVKQIGPNKRYKNCTVDGVTQLELHELVVRVFLFKLICLLSVTSALMHWMVWCFHLRLFHSVWSYLVSGPRNFIMNCNSALQHSEISWYEALVFKLCVYFIWICFGWYIVVLQ